MTKLSKTYLNSATCGIIIMSCMLIMSVVYLIIGMYISALLGFILAAAMFYLLDNMRKGELERLRKEVP